MADEYSETTPAWIETSALTAPALLGAAAGLLTYWIGSVLGASLV